MFCHFHTNFGKQYDILVFRIEDGNDITPSQYLPARTSITFICALLFFFCKLYYDCSSLSHELVDWLKMDHLSSAFYLNVFSDC